MKNQFAIWISVACILFAVYCTFASSPIIRSQVPHLILVFCLLEPLILMNLIKISGKGLGFLMKIASICLIAAGALLVHSLILENLPETYIMQAIIWVPIFLAAYYYGYKIWTMEPVYVTRFRDSVKYDRY